MSLIFAYDFETTGLPLYHEPSDDPRQPHIVQAAGILADSDTRQILASVDLISRPDGWEIPDDVAEIHGITTEHAKQVGIPERAVISAMVELWKTAGARVAHNERFDMRLMRIALKRNPDIHCPDDWKERKGECTGLLSKPIMKMEPKGRYGHKMPKLVEAYKHFCDKELPDAHSAMPDAMACLQTYWAIKDLEQAPAKQAASA